MATAEATRLTDAFRAAEARRAAMVAAAVALYFQQRVRADDPQSVERWLATLVPIILRERSASESRAVLFGNTLRTLELGLLDDFRFEPVPVADLVDRVRTSLVVTGPVGLQKRLEKISGRDLPPVVEKALIDEAIQQSSAAAGGSAARHVQNGGREALFGGAARDQRALGFVRVTKADPCYFCAMLASRGPVYKGDSFDESDPRFIGDGEVKVHDSCACSVRPIYRRDDEILERSKTFAAIWNDSTAGTSGAGAIRAFRRAYEGR